MKDTVDPCDKDYEPTRDSQIIHNETLEGNMFIRESNKILGNLREIIIGTDSEIWIKGIKCVRNAIQKLQEHYHGTSEGACFKQVSKEDLKEILYKNKTNFNFHEVCHKFEESLQYIR